MDFALWHKIHSRVHWLTLVAMCGHTKREEMSGRVALMPGWPRECMWSKMSLQKEEGIKGRKIGVEMSPKRARESVRGMEVMERKGDFFEG